MASCDPPAPPEGVTAMVPFETRFDFLEPEDEK
jgi:hypothetical protein